ncbi:hypothetical protein SFRURICE_016821 [Spodoptera frugiperda]|nr:hypothetical protein SFRURICE_016821 [Spodoptera frugiperda]
MWIGVQCAEYVWQVTPTPPPARRRAARRDVPRRASLCTTAARTVSNPGDPFCGDIDGVPLGQRGVLPGPTQINCRAFRARGSGTCYRWTHAAGRARYYAPQTLYHVHPPTVTLNWKPHN